ncbi:23462_t:CDS:2, partial [Gigaspora rosea]
MSQVKRTKYEEEDLEERIYNYLEIEEEGDFYCSSSAVCPRPDLFENLEYYTSLVSSAVSSVNIQINNNRNNCSSVCIRMSLAVVISSGSGAISSIQVTSDLSIQKEQFKINNIAPPN